MKKKALVIDDEKVVLDSISKILTDENFEVHTTLYGKGGISLAIKKPYDIVLTDIRMPYVDGFKVLRDIRRFKPAIPVVIITGYATVDSALQAMKLGATNYIEKPFTPDQLIRTVASAMEDTSNGSPEEQIIIHRKEILKILKKGASDRKFANRIFERGADALEKYNLTNHEKLAIITADIDWIEDQIGTLKPDHKQWLIDAKKHFKQKE
jgi:DNA-binding NtrC family response regulator